MPDMSVIYSLLTGVVMQRDFKGIWFPKEVWLDKRINALDKVILLEITSLDQSDDGCYASNQYLAEFCQCSERKVTDSISRLIALGYIAIASFDGRTRHIKSQLKVDSQNLLGRIAENATQSSKICEAESQNLLPINNKEITKEFTNISNKRNKQRKGDINALIDAFTDNEALQEALADYVDMRKLMKKPMTERAMTLLLNKLKGLSDDEEEQISLVNTAIEHNWQSVYLPQPKKGENGITLKANRQDDLDGIF